jgi:L,D-transpeptidase catalytic domain
LPAEKHKPMKKLIPCGRHIEPEASREYPGAAGFGHTPTSPQRRGTRQSHQYSKRGRISSTCSAVWGLAILFATSAIALPSALAEPPQLPSPKRAEYRIAIHCSLKVLQLWRDNQLFREYPIETGKGGVGKHRSGDHRTPVGDYEVSWMACRNGSKGHRIIDQRSWCKGNCFIDAPTGPALEKLWTDSYGGDEAAVISINYPNIKDRQRGFTGDCIHIHSNKRVIDGMMKKSYGCIHMYPKDAMELYNIVEVGTPVKMLP